MDTTGLVSLGFDLVGGFVLGFWFSVLFDFGGVWWFLVRFVFWVCRWLGLGSRFSGRFVC